MNFKVYTLNLRSVKIKFDFFSSINRGTKLLNIMIENDLLPENIGKMPVSEDNVFVHKFKKIVYSKITNWYSIYFSS